VKDERQAEVIAAQSRKWPVWLYLFLFTFPAFTSFSLMIFGFSMAIDVSSLTALAVMNGSINSVIAYLTIRLDDKSSESLQHLETINREMGELEEVLQEANTKVQRFTGHLEEAKSMVDKVGVDLDNLDLQAVSDVVEKLKENKDGLTEVLDHFRQVDVSEYITQLKRIDLKKLLDAVEEIMGFIENRNKAAVSPMKDFKPTLEAIPVPEDDEDDDPEWFTASRPVVGRYDEYDDDSDDEQEEDEEEPDEPDVAPSLTLERKKAPTLERKKTLTLNRR
jgi:DNA-directed RNA polymerase subunit F